MPQLRDVLDRRLAADFVGREEEIDLLLQTLEQDGPLVVIRALRKKLADNASVIETVQGVGYRLRRFEEYPKPELVGH